MHVLQPSDNDAANLGPDGMEDGTPLSAQTPTGTIASHIACWTPSSSEASSQAFERPKAKRQRALMEIGWSFAVAVLLVIIIALLRQR
jgi:hypothetical protein